MTLTGERPTAAKPAYVGGLDGLRAVAVVAVIVYHFAPKTLPAGFLGVDVFFVVSGSSSPRSRARTCWACGTSGLAAPAGCSPRSRR
jgi:hypothetical protein